MNVRRVAIGAYPITVEQARQQCRVDGDSEDDLLQSYIAAATSRLSAPDGYTTIALGAHTYEMALDAFPSAEIYLPVGPVGSVGSVTYTDEDGAEQTVSPSDYVLDAQPDRDGWVIPASGFSWPATMAVANAVRVRWMVSADCPEEVRQAVRLMVGHWYQNREAGDIPAAVYHLVAKWRRFTLA